MNDIGHLVMTLQSNREVVRVDAFDQHGKPVAVFIEIPTIKPCRCGNARSKHKVRVVAPRSIGVCRAEHKEIP